MAIWDILGIEETKDKEQIQAAYRQKLAVTNPEDSPEAFMTLRQALEAALKATEATETADSGEKGGQADGPTWDESPLGLWMRRVDDVYRHFSRRIDPMEWKALLEDEVCQNLDMCVRARDMLLEYMLDHFFLPQSVILLLDEHFSLRENMDDLKESFPPQFLDIVIAQSAEQKEYPPYECLKGDDSLDFDRYLMHSSKLGDCLEKGDVKEAHAIIAVMEDSGIESPFLIIDKAKAYCQEERFEEAEALLESLDPEYKTLADVRLMRGDVWFFLGKRKQARQAYEAALKQDPDSPWGRFGLAKCLTEEGRYKEASEMLCQLLDEDPYDAGALEWLHDCNGRYKDQLEQRLGEEASAGEQQETLFELAWCNFQNESYKETLRLLASVQPEEDRKIEYNSLMGRACLYDGQDEAALQYFQNWESLLRDLSDEGEDGKKKKEQFPLVLLLESGIYSRKQEYGKALEMLNRILEKEPEHGMALEQKGQVLYDSWNLERAVEVLDRSIAVNPKSHVSYLLRAKAYYRMEEYGSAFDDCEQAIAIYPYELTAHLQEVRILTDARQFEQAEEVLRYLRQEGLSGSELRFMEAYLEEGKGSLGGAKKNLKKAKNAYKAIVSQHEKKKDTKTAFELEDLAEVYYRIALLDYDEGMEDFGQVVRIIDKGLAENDRYVPLLELKAHIACQCGFFDKALILYQSILKEAPGKPGTFGLMDMAYRELGQWDKAFGCAQLQVEQTPTGYAYMRRGQLFTCLGRTKEAWDDFAMALKLSPDQPYIYNYMGAVLELEGREDEAIDHYERAIALGKQEEDFCDEACRNAANLYCRKKEYARAGELLRKAYEGTGDVRYLSEEMELWRIAGQFGRAGETLGRYQKAKSLKSDDFDVEWELASIYRDSGRLELAFALYDKLGAFEPAACREAAKILYHQEDCGRAVRYLDRAISMLGEPHKIEEDDYSRVDYYLWAAKARLRMGNFREAAILARKGLAQMPKGALQEKDVGLPMVYQEMGGLYAAAGQHEKALEFLEKALDMRKCDYCDYDCCIDALYEMGDLFQQQGDLEKALQCYEKGLAAAPFDADLKLEAALVEKRKA